MDIKVNILGLQDKIHIRISGKRQIVRTINSLLKNCLTNFTRNLQLESGNAYLFFEVRLNRPTSTDSIRSN